MGKLTKFILLEYIILSFFLLSVPTHTQVTGADINVNTNENQYDRELVVLTRQQGVYREFWKEGLKGGLYHRSSIDAWTPQLADGMPEMSSDQLTWTIHLNPDLKFADGNPLTADDVVFTYQIMLTPQIEVPQDWEWLTYNYENSIIFLDTKSSITKINDDTVQFDFIQKDAKIWYFLALNIIEKEMYQSNYTNCINNEFNACNWSDFEMPISSGPYKVDQINDTIVKVSKNSYYFDFANVEASNITYYYLYDENNTIHNLDLISTLLDNGKVDILDIDASNLFPLNNTNLQNLYENVPVITQFQMIELNHNHPIWGNGTYIPDGSGITSNDDAQALLVRKAMSHLINRDQIANELYEGNARPSATEIGKSRFGYYDKLEPRNYSIQVAKNYMEMAGFNYSDIVDLNLDGDYNDTGDKSFFNITIMVYGNIQQRLQYSWDYAQALTKIGIGVHYQFLDPWTVWLRSIYWEKPSLVPIYDEGGYDLVFSGIRSSQSQPDWVFYESYMSQYLCNIADNQGDCLNTRNYSNKTLDALITNYTNELFLNLSSEILKDIQIALYNDIPVIPIVHITDPFIIRKNIENVNWGLMYTGVQTWDNIKYPEWIKLTTNSKDRENSDVFGDFNSSQTGVIAAGILILLVVGSWQFIKRKS